MAGEINMFIIYAREDKDIKLGLVRHLKPFKEAYNLSIWHDDHIEPGEQWKPHIDSRLNQTDIFLLLVSVSFMNSKFIDEVEFKTAIDRHREKKSVMIPVIIDYCQWDLDFSKQNNFNLKELQVLPDEAKPIGDWKSPDKAYDNIAAGVRKVIISIKDDLEKEKLKKKSLEVLQKKEEERVAAVDAQEEERQRKEAEAKKQEEERKLKEKAVQEKRLKEESLAKIKAAEEEVWVRDAQEARRLRKEEDRKKVNEEVKRKEEERKLRIAARPKVSNNLFKRITKFKVPLIIVGGLAILTIIIIGGFVGWELYKSTENGVEKQLSTEEVEPIPKKEDKILEKEELIRPKENEFTQKTVNFDDSLKNKNIKNFASGDRYIGDLNSNGDFHGQGTYYYKKSGNKFEGNWINGKKTNGTYTFKSGDVLKFINGIEQ